MITDFQSNGCSLFTGTSPELAQNKVLPNKIDRASILPGTEPGIPQ